MARWRWNGGLLVALFLGAGIIATAGVAFSSRGPTARRVASWGHAVKDWVCAPRAFHHCKQNLVEISSALESYGTDHGGRFPSSLGLLVPRYLRRIPTCPAASCDTYTSGYAGGPSAPGLYTVLCAGRHHALRGQGENHPQCVSTRGLVVQ